MNAGLMVNIVDLNVKTTNSDNKITKTDSQSSFKDTFDNVVNRDGELEGAINENVREETTAYQGVYKKIEMSEENIEDIKECLNTFLSGLKEKICNMYNISEEDLDNMLDTLALTMTDLIQPENLKELVAQLDNVTDVTDMMSNEDFFNNYKELTAFVSELTSNIEVEYNINIDKFLEDSKTLVNINESNTVSVETEPTQSEDTIEDTNDDIELDINIEENIAEVPVETLVKRGETVKSNLDVANDKNIELADDMASSTDVPEVISEKVVNTVNTGSQIVTQVTSKTEDGTEKKITFSVEDTQNLVKEDEQINVKTDEGNTDSNTAGQNMFDNFIDNLSEVMDETMIEEPRTTATDIINQIVDAIDITNSESVTDIEIALTPESLGKVNVNISSKEGVITATITTENEIVKNLVETQLISLKESLANQGIKVDSVEVMVSNHDFNNQDKNREKDTNTKADKKFRYDDYEDGGFDEEIDLARIVRMENGNSIEYEI